MTTTPEELNAWLGVIVLNERHLKRPMHDYIRYYHEERTHLGLAKDTPEGRSVASDRPTEAGFNHSLDSVACINVTPWQHKRVILHTYKM